MKNFIYTKNQELLEKHPTAWNTKIVWVLAIAFIVHILFYLMGCIALMDPESLQNYNAMDVFFENGAVFFSIMISILLLVVWLIAMFRNNAFKNFYPTSRFKLFKQFATYFIIVFSCTTFYYSYSLGIQTYIQSAYGKERMKKDVALANQAAPFFSLELDDYELDQLRYPSPFDQLFCATGVASIEFDKKHYSFKDNSYQFYSIKKEVYDIDEFVSPESVQGNILNDTEEGQKVFYFKDKVIDVDPYIQTSQPSYYNYNGLFYEDVADDSDYYYDYGLHLDDDYNPFTKISPKQQEQIQMHQGFLEAGDKEAYQKLFYDFLTLAQEYQIANNLNTDSWMNLVNTQSPYVVKGLIHNKNKPYEPTITYDQESDFVKYEKTLISRHYLDASSLKQSFKNIDNIKSTNIFEGSIHFFLWFAFIISCIIFIFRTTGLKSLLFSIVAAVLLMIFVGLISALYGFIIDYRSGMEYFVMYFVLLLGTIILMMSLFGLSKVNKLIASLFMNITIIGFVPYLLLILGIIDTHQRDWCRTMGYNNYTYENQTDECMTVFEYLDVYWSYVLLVFGILFLYFFCKNILKWRAQPEG